MITSGALSYPHGFMTRQGGVSRDLFASLNCGLGSGDDLEAVAENRARAVDRLGLPPDALITLYQCHSATAVAVTAGTGERPEADALVTDRPNLALGILTADCAPVLFADAKAGVIGAAHAGWRGARNGILENTVAAMEALGAHVTDIRAAIGPCIAQESYEVDESFRAAFAGQDRFFAPGRRDGHHQFDLPGYAAARLEALGLGRVTRTGEDTYRDEDRFFSYRRSCHRGETVYGRGISLIAIIL